MHLLDKYVMRRAEGVPSGANTHHRQISGITDPVPGVPGEASVGGKLILSTPQAYCDYAGLHPLTPQKQQVCGDVLR
jgi:hypothetical protein